MKYVVRIGNEEHEVVLDGDGVHDMLIAQNVAKVEGDKAVEISCLTAVTLDGKVLWQNGRPDPRNGLLTNVGTTVSFGGRQRPIPRTYQWSYTLERELPWSTVLELSYVGSLTVKEPMSLNLSDALQKEYEIAAANPNYFQQTVPNPWFGVAPTNTTLGAASVISRQNLLPEIQDLWDYVSDANAVAANPYGTDSAAAHRDRLRIAAATGQDPPRRVDRTCARHNECE